MNVGIREAVYECTYASARELRTARVRAWDAIEAGELFAQELRGEVDAATMAAMIEARREGLEAEARARGEDPRARLRGLRAGIRAAPAGERILANFVAAIRG